MEEVLNPDAWRHQSLANTRPTHQDITEAKRHQPEAPRGRLLIRLVLIAGLIIAAVNLLDLETQPDRANAKWMGSGRVCDFNGKCSDRFACRSADDGVEIYLPYGSFETGNAGWEWQEDVGDRCGQRPD